MHSSSPTGRRRALTRSKRRYPPVAPSGCSCWASTPLDVEQAVIELVGERFRARERIGLSAKTLGGQETTGFVTASPFNATIAALLAPYRRVVPW